MGKLEGEELGFVEDFKKLFVSMVHPCPDSRIEIDEVLESEWAQGPRKKIAVL